jgi:hypothetical protein
LLHGFLLKLLGLPRCWEKIALLYVNEATLFHMYP